MFLAILVFFLLATSLGDADAASLDAGYGRGGVASVDFPGADYALAGTLQADGKLVLAGVADDAVAVARLTDVGLLDSSFGWGGVARIEVGDMSGVGSVRVGGDGSIYLAGWTYDRPQPSDSEYGDGDASFAADRVRLVLVKLTRRGILDPSFGADGIVTTEPGVLQPVDDVEVDMVVTPEGSMVVLALRGVSAGWYGFAGGAVLARFAPNGDLDDAFGVGGVAAAGPPGIVPAPTALVLQGDGSLVVGATWVDPGLVPFAPPSWDLLVTRYLSTGMPDVSFGTGGVVRYDLAGGTDAMSDLGVDGDGRIVVVGETLETVAAATSPTYGWSPFVLRLTPTGLPDPTFGRAGVTDLDEEDVELIFAGAAAVQRGGGVVLTALALRGTTVSTELLRLGPDGRRDRAFGSVTIPMRAVTNVSVGGGRVYAGGFLRDSGDGSPDTFAAAAVPVPS